jgi:hypothetical protein
MFSLVAENFRHTTAVSTAYIEERLCGVGERVAPMEIRTSIAIKIRVELV